MKLSCNTVHQIGCWQVLHPKNRISRNGNHYLTFQISDGDTVYAAHAWKGQYHGPDKLTHGQSIHITGKWIEFNGRHVLQCRTLSPTKAEPMALLKTRTRARILLNRLTTPLLRQFVVKVFEDDQLLQQFLSLPASTGYHHGYPGGLFIHSVDVAWQLYRNLEIQGQEKDVAVVAGLLHDIGKVYSYTPEGKLTPHGRHIDHDAETLVILGPALNWLEAHNSSLCLMLKHHLTWNSNKRKKPLYGSALQVRFADQFSTVAEICRSTPSMATG